LIYVLILCNFARLNNRQKYIMKTVNWNLTAEGKFGTKTKVFSNTSAITWNLKRRFK